MSRVSVFFENSLERIQNKSVIIFIDFQLIFLSYIISFFLRFDFIIPSQFLKMMFFTLPVVLGIKIFTYIYFNIHRIIWKFTGISDLIKIIKVSSFNNALFALILFALIGFKGYPRSVILIDWFLTIMFLGGSRIACRHLATLIKDSNNHRNPSTTKKCIILGSGEAAEGLIREMVSGKIDYIPLAILDDDPKKWGLYLHNVKIYGPIKDIGVLLDKFRIDEIVIAIPSATRAQMAQILKHCKPCIAKNIKCKTVPGINEILSGLHSLTKLREVRLEDLMNRELVMINQVELRREFAHKTVLVTGAAGSIGSELARQIYSYNITKLILLDRNENNLLYLEKELETRYPEIRYETVVTDITDKAMVERVFRQYRPQYIFHAAAYKHVPYMEKFPAEAVKNNVYGTYVLAGLAEKHHATKFILISTDKAVCPTSVMGCTKRVAEMSLLHFFKDSDTSFIIVRFGNVLGSNGSVIPLFKQQIEKGGPLTVTHPEMRRYFMTIPEAVSLTLKAGSIGEHGDIMILDMGEQIPIIQIAENLIRLSGYTPYKDIPIQISGIRPGEKLYEELWYKDENPIPTNHPKIFKATQFFHKNGLDVEAYNTVIQYSLSGEQNDRILKLLRHLVPDFRTPKFGRITKKTYIYN